MIWFRDFWNKKTQTDKKELSVIPWRRQDFSLCTAWCLLALLKWCKFPLEGNWNWVSKKPWHAGAYFILKVKGSCILPNPHLTLQGLCWWGSPWRGTEGPGRWPEGEFQVKSSKTVSAVRRGDVMFPLLPVDIRSADLMGCSPHLVEWVALYFMRWYNWSKCGMSHPSGYACRGGRL